MDPLKPFGDVTRNLWSKALKRAEHKEGSAESALASESNAQAVATSAEVRPMRNDLRERLASMSKWDTNHARAMFIESVLLTELGTDLAKDPMFADVIANISRQIGDDALLSGRLDQLLKAISRR